MRWRRIRTKGGIERYEERERKGGKEEVLLEV